MAPKSPWGQKTTINPKPALPPAIDYNEVQSDEIDALKAIYMDDYEDVETKSAWNKTTDRSFKLKVRSSTDTDSSIVLSVGFSVTYPKSPPLLEVTGLEGYHERTQTRIHNVIRSRPKQLLGEVMIHAIATELEEALEDAVSARQQGTLPSLEEERASAEEVASGLAKEAEEAEARRRQDAQNEEERVLSQMVSDELNRRETRKSNKLPPALTSQPSIGGDDVVAFEQSATVQVENETLHFNAVAIICPLSSSKSEQLYLGKIADTNSSALVAVKKLICNEPRDGVVQIESMLENVRSLRHPNLLSLLALRIDRIDNGPISQFILCSDYADRGTMRDLLEVAGPLHPEKARRFTIEILEALDYLHNNGVAHGSLSTSSIFLHSTPSLSPKLGQLGQWVLQPPKGAVPAKWEAPEGEDVSPSLRRKSDIWSLGVVVVELFIGHQVLNEYQSPLSLLTKFNMSDTFDDFIRKMFALDARKRPSAFDLLPVEFLRTDAPVMDELPTGIVRRRRHTSSAGATASPTQRRSRHNSSSLLEPMSRYAADFTELGRLGKGGFGEVVKARNKLDGGVYAIKKVKQAPQLLSEVISEVMLLNRLNHPYVVRYFSTWVEETPGTLSESVTTTTDDNTDDSSSDGPRMDFGYQSTGGLDFVSSSGYPEIEFGDDDDEDEKSSGDETDEGTGRNGNGELALESSMISEIGDLGLRHLRSNSHRPPSTLYIQMEYCERHTLRDLIRKHLSEDDAWRYVRQVTEGLSHIHSHGIIHRDLKPENVFIDVAGNTKIGDFGLATTSQYHVVERTAPFSGQSSGEMTRSVGTALYVAPELRSASGGSYNDKVDMYSLGIMFFEMCEVFGTAMERIRALQSIREREHILPSAYNANGEKVAQGRLIECLISHKPSERASSTELLRSDILPVKVEDEAIRQALSGLSDPRSPYHQKIMSALFSHDSASGGRVKALAWGSETQPDASRIRLRTIARQSIESIFRKHGAEEARRPTVFPRSTHNTDPSVVALLDASGNLLQLPYDLILPHARQLALHKPSVKKSFAFGNAYRDAFTGGSPRVNDEVDFDIALTGPDDDKAFDEAEVLKVMDEIMSDIPAFATSANVSFHLNHTFILDRILEHCRVPAAQQSIVKETISRLGFHQWTWLKVRGELRKIGLSDTTLDDLQQFDFRDVPEKACARLRTLLTSVPSVSTDRLNNGIQSLLQVVQLASQLSLQRKLWIVPLGSVNAKFYDGGMLFQCVLERKSNRTVIAAGGRYDSLVQAHRPTSTPVACHGAVGVAIGLDSILTHMSKTSMPRSKGMFHKDVQQVEVQPKRCDVLVEASDTDGARTAAIKLLSTLWANNISAELATDTHSHTDREEYNFAVTVRHEASNTVRVSNIVSDGEDTDVPISALVTHLHQEFRERESSKPHHPAFTRQASHHDADRKNNVQVLLAQHRSKKTNKYQIVEGTQRRWAEKVEGWKEAPILAAEISDEVLESIRETRLGDPESWRKAVQSVPMNERLLIQQVQDMLGSWRKRWTENAGEREACVSNFRTGTCIYYDLGL